MAEDVKTLEDLKDVVEGTAAALPVEPEAEAAPAEPKIDELGRAYATGKRKNAIARVWIKPGAGKITVNGREVETYFARPVLRMIINQAFTVASRRPVRHYRNRHRWWTVRTGWRRASWSFQSPDLFRAFLTPGSEKSWLPDPRQSCR